MSAPYTLSPEDAQALAFALQAVGGKAFGFYSLESVVYDGTVAVDVVPEYGADRRRFFLDRPLDAPWFEGFFLRALLELRMWPSVQPRQLEGSLGWDLHTIDMLSNPGVQGPDLLPLLASALICWGKANRPERTPL